MKCPEVRNKTPHCVKQKKTWKYCNFLFALVDWMLAQFLYLREEKEFAGKIRRFLSNNDSSENFRLLLSYTVWLMSKTKQNSIKHANFLSWKLVEQGDEKIRIFLIFDLEASSFFSARITKKLNGEGYLTPKTQKLKTFGDHSLVSPSLPLLLSLSVRLSLSFSLPSSVSLSFYHLFVRLFVSMPPSFSVPVSSLFFFSYFLSNYLPSLFTATLFSPLIFTLSSVRSLCHILPLLSIAFLFLPFPFPPFIFPSVCLSLSLSPLYSFGLSHNVFLSHSPPIYLSLFILAISHKLSSLSLPFYFCFSPCHCI